MSPVVQRPANQAYLVYTSTVLYAALALHAGTAVATPQPMTPSGLVKRQGMQWNKEGSDCAVTTARACIARGGDPTLGEADKAFSDGNSCRDETFKYTAKVAKGINDAGETGYCTITMKTDDRCCVNGLCSAQEIGKSRQVVKTTDAYSEETIQDVHFSTACPKGTWIQSEIRLV
ncbi:hypothetical protein PG993_012525 [Apiospora rasikravindrae]|uniref:Secreted protein n=1 Tax=Apiospora rasikravindrae TaxID=990691 RepID=A0ABR1S2N5_9PEZI